jgi:hypothetical protein
MVHKKRAKLHAAKRNRNKKLNDRFRAHKPAAESRAKQIIGILTSECQHNLSSESKAAEPNSTGKLTLTNTNIGASLRLRCGY